MKVMLILLAFGLNAQSAETIPHGKFSSPHDVPVFNYESKDACEADKGKWDQEMESCFFATEDSVTIVRKRGYDLVTVSTVATNGHSCEFSAKRPKWISANTFIAVAKGEDYSGEKPSVNCEVTLTFKDFDTVSVTSTFETCRSFCGANGDLTIDDAKRVK